MVVQLKNTKARSLGKLFCLLCLYSLSLLIAQNSFAADTATATTGSNIGTLYSLNINTNSGAQNSATAGQISSSIATIHLDSNQISNLDPDTTINVPMPDGKLVTGTLIKLIDDTNSASRAAAASATQKKVVSLDNNLGSVELILINNVVTEMVLHDVAREKIYRADINANGDGQFQLQNNDDYYCFRYPENDTPLPAFSLQSPQVAAATPDLNTLKNLQSRAGATNVLFVDYWGGSISDTAWNATNNSNNPINYSAYDRDGNPGNFSTSERYSMWLAWREAAEDFAPFNINITTSLAVYNTTAVKNRSRMVVTTTSDWYGNAGGVAYVNVFNQDSDYYKVGWTWNLSDSSMGMTISHEAGHQMGLRHDGIGGQSYYSGHGVWGPIMGAPFGKRYVQWSKGDYPNANEDEDDIGIVNGKLGLIADQAGNSYASATTVTLPVNNSKALIGFGDIDTYKFNLSTTGQADINVITLLGDEDEARAANLSMDVSLARLDASGGVISNIASIKSTDNSPLSPLTNKFEYSGTLAAGTYGLRITPRSPDTNWTTGFDSYGIAGEYRFTINATQQNAPDLIVQPISVSDSTLTPGQNFSISATVKNQGNAASGSTTLTYYRSTDSAINTNDEQLATDSIPTLSANANSPQTATVSAPATPGSYWIGACVNNVANESDLQNNCSAAVQISVSPPPQPDLTISQFNLSSFSFTPNQNFTISAAVENQGNTSANASILRYYRSTDATINSADIELATKNIASLPANNNSPENVTVSAPNSLGNFWIGVCVDTVNNESNLQNNCSAPIQISVSAQTEPDLVANSVTLSQSSLRPNQRFNISATVFNRGSANSNSTRLRYFRSSNSTISRSDTQLGTDNIGSLNPNNTSIQSTNVSAPSVTGSYWIGACVDSVANESNPNNNCSSGARIEVSTNPTPVTDECTFFIIPIKNKSSIVVCL